MTEELIVPDHRAEALKALKAKADMLGISYSPNIGEDTLRARINEKLEGPVVAKPASGKESEVQRKMRLRREATRNIRCQVTCMDPTRKGWRGENITSGNAMTGSITKFIPFDAPDGWHIPKIILNAMKERFYQHHYIVTVNGRDVNKQRSMPAFAITELPALTVEELQVIAERQLTDRE